MVQRPIPAFESLREDMVQIDGRELTGLQPLSEFKPERNTYEIEATFEIIDPYARFGIHMAVSGDSHISVGYDSRTSILFLDRMNLENSGFNGRFPKYAISPLQTRDGKVDLHIYVDQSSIEVFANDGEVTMSALMFPDPGNLGIVLFAENGRARLIGLTAWKLASIWGVPTKSAGADTSLGSPQRLFAASGPGFFQPSHPRKGIDSLS
jgi:fructan beta-fructosidase